MAVRTAFDAVNGAVLNETSLDKYPGGWIGYVEVTANQGSITTEVDLTSLTLTVTVGTSRRLKIYGEAATSSTVANDIAGFSITDGTPTYQQLRTFHLPVASGSQCCHATAVKTPSSGSNTYKLRMSRASGTGTVTMTASASSPALIIVEDIGPSA